MHLSQAGKSIRTEKILNELRAHFGVEDTREAARDILLLAEENHDIRFDRKLTAGTMIKKVFCNQEKVQSEHVMGIESIRKHLKDGHNIFFSDEQIVPDMITNDLGISIMNEHKRMYARDLKIYSNHIFFVVCNCKNSSPCYEKINLNNNNFCVMIVGTGKFSNINICKCSAEFSRIVLKKNQKIGNYQSDWEVVLESTKEQGATIKFDKVEFFSNKKKDNGVRVVILDPISKIVVDHFFYFDFSEHIDKRLYQLNLFPEFDTLSLNALHCTGGNPPKSSLADEVLKIVFTGENSFVGWRVKNDKTGYLCLVLDVRKCGDGDVFAGHQGNTKYGIVSTPLRREVTNRCKWERVVLDLEINEYFGRDGGYAYLGLWANKIGVTIEIKNPRLYYISRRL